MLSRKKAQVSIEVLAVLGILVIGSILFGAYYLNSIYKSQNKAIDLSTVVDDFEKQLNPDGIGNNISPLLTCGNGNVDPGETCDNCPQDFDPGFCDTIIGFFTITTSLLPNIPSPTNTDFGIYVYGNNQTGLTGVVIKKIVVNTGSPLAESSNCSYNNQVINGTLDNLTLPLPCSGANCQTTLDKFKCSVPGTYNIGIYAGINGDSNSSKNDFKSINKTITATTILSQQFFVEIVEPDPKKVFTVNDSINFTAVTSPIADPTDLEYCYWYIDETPIQAEGESSCSIQNFSFTGKVSPGLHNVVVYATRENTRNGTIVQAKDSIEIMLLPTVNPGELFLLATDNVFVEDSFDVLVFGLQQNQTCLPITNSNFTFQNTSCRIISSGICDTSTVLNNGSQIYVNNYVAVCDRPSYSQTGNHDLVPVNVTLQPPYPSGITTVTPGNFKVGYDLLFRSGKCNTSATNYGLLQACATSTEGLNINPDYWEDIGYGLFKIYVDGGHSTTSNDYGKLTVYVSE